MNKTATDGDGLRVPLLRNPGAQHEVASAGTPELLSKAGLSDDRRATSPECCRVFRPQNNAQFVAALGGEDP